MRLLANIVRQSLKRLLAIGIVVAIFIVSTAQGAYSACGDLSVGGGVECAQGNASGTELTSTVGNVVNILLFVAGMAAVIAIIIGGVRYITSQGDEKAVKGAKDTILYAVIGVVVALLAYAIVNFVLGRL